MNIEKLRSRFIKEHCEVRGDWAYFVKDNNSKSEHLEYGFVGYTLRHKIRLFFGMNGRQHDGSYTFKAPEWGNIKFRKKMYSFMHYIGNPLLNFLIGYKRL